MRGRFQRGRRPAVGETTKDPPPLGGSSVCLVELQRNRRGNCCMIASLSVSDISRMCWWIES
jgi:hypothetical protein